MRISWCDKQIAQLEWNVANGRAEWQWWSSLLWWYSLIPKYNRCSLVNYYIWYRPFGAMPRRGAQISRSRLDSRGILPYWVLSQPSNGEEGKAPGQCRMCIGFTDLNKAYKSQLMVSQPRTSNNDQSSLGFIKNLWTGKTYPPSWNLPLSYPPTTSSFQTKRGCLAARYTNSEKYEKPIPIQMHESR
jgi:hypothetical protein